MTGLPTPPPAGAAMLPADTFAGDVVLVTGGGTGLGKGIAVEFSRAGAAVAIASRNADHRAAGVAAVEGAGGRAIGVPLDVRDPASVASCFDAIESRLGPVGILVNNAAGNFPVAAENLSANGWATVVDIVLNGTFNCSSAFARRRIAIGGSGAILNVAATTALTGGPATAHSAAAKAGVVNMTKSLAVEWAVDGIRVNALAPGVFPHDDHVAAMSANRPEGYRAEAGRIPALRTGEVRELGWAATFLCSPFASYITGHMLVVDGGNWLRRGVRMPEFTPPRETVPARPTRDAAK